MLIQWFRSLARTVLLLALSGVPFAVGDAPTNAQQVGESKQGTTTTVLLVRHADRDGEDLLNSQGIERSRELVAVVEKVGVKAIFMTPTQRSQQTVQPLAENLQPKPEINLYPYSKDAPKDRESQYLKEQVLGNYAGQVVLVAAHGDTLVPIVEAFGGNPDHCKLTSLGEYDNLCVINVHAPGQANVLNLQYGKPSQ